MVQAFNTKIILWNMASHIQSSNNWRLNVTMDCMPAIGMCFLWISAKKIQSHMFFTCHYSKQVWFVFLAGGLLQAAAALHVWLGLYTIVYIDNLTLENLTYILIHVFFIKIKNFLIIFGERNRQTAKALKNPNTRLDSWSNNSTK